MRTWFCDYFLTVISSAIPSSLWRWLQVSQWLICECCLGSCVTLSKCITELDGFGCLKTKLRCLSSVVLLLSFLWIGAGMKYIWVCISKGEEDMSDPDAFCWIPLDLKLLQIITRIMDAEINYGPFEKKTHKKLGIQRMHLRWKPCWKWFSLQLLRICHYIFCGTLCCC